ncbi:MAG: CpsB/CapC family capsule biosynthesis tyrosine phosphatase [Solirubrobacteraceae bacterium]
MIDLHCHILWGIDDGPATIEDSLELARAAVAAGTRLIVATSHVSWGHRNDAATIAGRVATLNERLATEGIELEVRPGAEIAATLVSDIAPEQLAHLTIGGAGGRWLLVEPPFTPVVTGIDALIYGLQRDGYQILLAHPERCMGFHRDREMLERLVGAGVLTSITAGSLVGRFGKPVRRFAHELVRDELVHNVASDAHDVLGRPPGMASEIAEAGFASLADWLTQAVPQAILAGAEIPRRPPVAFDSGGERHGMRWLRRRD